MCVCVCVYVCIMLLGCHSVLVVSSRYVVSRFPGATTLSMRGSPTASCTTTPPGELCAPAARSLSQVMGHPFTSQLPKTKILYLKMTEKQLVL